MMSPYIKSLAGKPLQHFLWFLQKGTLHGAALNVSKKYLNQKLKLSKE